MGLYAGSQNANIGAYYLSQNEALDLKWETGEAYGIALEGRLFNRWNISLEYFDKRNKDLLFDVYLPLSAGATSTTSAQATIAKNLGTISNKGFEINTDIDIYKDKKWKVNFATNATFVKNKIVKLPEQNKDGIISGNYKIVEGKSRYEFFLPTYVGVDQLTGNSLYTLNLEDYFITLPDGSKLGNAEGTDISDNESHQRHLLYQQHDLRPERIPRFGTTQSLRQLYRYGILQITYFLGLVHLLVGRSNL